MNSISKLTHSKLFVFIIISLFFAVATFLVGYAIYLGEEDKLRSEIETTISEGLNRTKSVVSTEIAEAAKDVVVLSKDQSIQEYLQSPNDLARSEIEKEFVNFGTFKNIYDQVRFLDSTGNEIVRINDADFRVSATSEDKLQNKADRYYFQEAEILRENTIYLSPLDLNVEGESIETPEKPVIRFSTPIYSDKTNEFGGIAITNMLGEVIIDDIIALQENGYRGELHFVNSDSYWLYNNAGNTNWGFMYDSKLEERFENRYSSIWENIESASEGQFYIDNLLVTFTTIDVEDALLNSVNTSEVLINSDVSWKLIDITDTSLINSELSEARTRIGSLLVAILLVLILFIRQSVYSVARQLGDAKEIKDLNKTLKLLMKVLRHDILNNLTITKFSIELLNDPLITEKDKLLEDIEKSTSRSINLIGDIKDVEMMESKLSLKKLEAIKISKVINSLKDEMSGFKLNLYGDATVLADNTIHSLFSNLVNNSKRHGGVKEADIDVKADASKATILFSDKGKGIPDDVKPHIFDEGYKHGENANTGLGLFIVKQSVERYGGNIKVVDNTPSGVMFKIELPLA